MNPKGRGRRYWLRLGRFLGISLLLASVLLVLYTSYTQAWVFLHPPRQIVNGGTLRSQGIVFRTVELITEDGVRLRAWYTPPRNGALILVAHGHAGSILEDIYALFARHGYGVIAWDFRAHGGSGGDFTTLGYYEVLDVKAALEYALGQPQVRSVGGWGGSMGAATMILSAARYPEIEAIVADSSYNTLEEELKLRIPLPVFRGLTRFFAELQTGASLDGVRPVDAIAGISPRPVFIIQGMLDRAVPADSAQQLFEAAGEPRYLWTGEKASHLNMFARYPADYEQRVIDFFDHALQISDQ